MSEAFNMKCKRLVDKPVKRSKNLAEDRIQLHKPCTLLNEQIFQWHSHFAHGKAEEHKMKASLVVHKLLFYI